MSFTELIPILQALPRSDKFRLLQFLVLDLAREEDALLELDNGDPVWTPYNACEAADAMLKTLGEEKITYDE